MNKKQSAQLNTLHSAKEIARTAVFVAMLIGAQYAFSAVPFVEIVTLLFACYAYVFGAMRGVVAAVAFALLRQFLFGFYPVVLILYLAHFSLLSVVFGAVGKYCPLSGWRRLLLVVAVAMFCTVCFTLLDNVLTPMYYGYSERAAKMYFRASLPFMIGQTVCVAVSMGVLFVPLTKALLFIKKA